MRHEHVQVKSVIKTCRKKERVTFCYRGSHSEAGTSCMQRMINETSHKISFKLNAITPSRISLFSNSKRSLRSLRH